MLRARLAPARLARYSVLTSSLYSNARRIYGAFGIDDLIDFERLLHRAPVSAADRRRGMRRRAEPDGFPLGDGMDLSRRLDRAAALIVRLAQRFEGAPDPRDPADPRGDPRSAPDHARLCARSRGYAVRRAAGSHPRQRAQLSRARAFRRRRHQVRGIPTIHFIQPSREDGFIFKRLTRETRRIHPNSITRETLTRLLAEPWTDAKERELDDDFHKRYSGVWKIQARNQPGTVDMTPAEVRAALNLDPSKKTAVLFSHVLWDANLFYGEDLFDNYGHWFAETVAAAAANPALNWIIKLHPANLWKRQLSGVTSEYGEMALIRERVGKLPPHVCVLPPDTKVSTLSLFRSIDAGITVRGSIGYELPCFGVPVVTAGTGRYSGFRLHPRPRQRRELPGDAREARDGPAPLRRSRAPRQGARARTALRAALGVPQLPLEFGTDVKDPFYQNLLPTVGSDAEIARNGDLDAFARWAEDFVSTDYLAPAANPQAPTQSRSKASV